MASVRGPAFWRCLGAFLDFMVSPFWSAILAWQAPIWRCMVSWQAVLRRNTMLVAGFFAHAIADATSAAVLQPFPAAVSLSSRQGLHFAEEAVTIWAVWWLAMAFFSKSTKRRESPMQRVEHLLPAILGFALVFREGFGGAWLARPIISAHASLLWLCVMATILGLLFAVWARLILGSNWSGTVTIKTNHQLIRRG